MKKVVIQEGYAFVYLNSNFYNEKVILNTLEVYVDFFNANVTNLGKYFIVKISKLNDDHSLKYLSDEFLNYLLSLEYESMGTVK